MSMRILPRNTGVLIKKQEVIEERKVGSIILPQQSWSMNADVIPAMIEEIGDKVEGLRIGQRVLVGRFAGIMIEPQVSLVDEADIIAVMEDEVNFNTGLPRRS